MADLLAKWIAFLQFPEHWVTRTGGAAVAAFALVLSWICIELVPEEQLDWWLRIAICVIFAAISLFIWFIARTCYFMIGRGRKVAIAFDGYRVPGPELKRARQHISEISSARQLDGKVCIRLFPRHMLSTESRQESTLRTYRYSLAILIKVSPSKEDANHLVYSIEMMTPGKDVDTDWRKATLLHMSAILSRPAETRTLADIVDLRMSRLFDVVLLALAVTEFHQRNMTMASDLAFVLDMSLSDSLPADRQPRKAIRWLDLASLTYTASSPARTLWHNPTKLTKALNDYELAIQRYGSEQNMLFHTQARNWYIKGDFERARQVNAMARRDSLSKFEKAAFYLNDAVLCLANGQWTQASSRYRDFFLSGTVAEFDFEELCSFAELAMLRGDPGAEFMRLLYSRIAAYDVSEELNRQVDAWLADDAGRKCLEGTLRAYGRPSVINCDNKSTKKVSKAKAKREDRARKRGKRK